MASLGTPSFTRSRPFCWSLFGTIVSALTCGVAIPVFLGFHLYAAWRVYRGEEYEYPAVGDFTRGLLESR